MLRSYALLANVHALNNYCHCMKNIKEYKEVDRGMEWRGGGGGVVGWEGGGGTVELEGGGGGI